MSIRRLVFFWKKRSDKKMSRRSFLPTAAEKEKAKNPTHSARFLAKKERILYKTAVRTRARTAENRVETRFTRLLSRSRRPPILSAGVSQWRGRSV